MTMKGSSGPSPENCWPSELRQCGATGSSYLRKASTEGIYAEAAGVLSLAVIKKLRVMGKIDEEETVVALVTFGGLKDPATTQHHLPDVPLVEPSLEALRKGLAEAYGYILPAS